VSTTALGSASVCSAAPPTLFLTFPEALGDLRSDGTELVAAGVGESGLLVESGDAGSVDGVHPLWGFTLRFKGLATPLPIDASADEAEQALEALPNVGVASASSSCPRAFRSRLRRLRLERLRRLRCLLLLVVRLARQRPRSPCYAALPVLGRHVRRRVQRGTRSRGSSAPSPSATSRSFPTPPVLFFRRSPHALQQAPAVGAAEVTPGSSGNNRRYGFDGQNGFVEVKALQYTSSGLEASFERWFLGGQVPRRGQRLAHLEHLFHLHVPSSAPRPNDPAFAGAALWWCARSTQTSAESSKAITFQFLFLALCVVPCTENRYADTSLGR
jgi:hypothetical protein